jgi:hypothetical protein
VRYVAMEPKRNDVERQREIDDLLRRVHEESLRSAEPAPFWRDGGWRCELHLGDNGPRLKVFKSDACVHEEPTAPGAKAAARMIELRKLFVSRRDAK